MLVPLVSCKVGPEVQLKSEKRAIRSTGVKLSERMVIILGLIFYLILSRMNSIVNFFLPIIQRLRIIFCELTN